MEATHFSTEGFRPQDQFEAWREWNRPFDFIPKQSSSGFPATLRKWNLIGLAVTRNATPAVRLARTKTNLKRDPIDHWTLSYCSKEMRIIDAHGRVIDVPAKIPFLLSLRHEFVRERKGRFDRIQFVLPRDTFRDIAMMLDARCGSALDTPLGHILGDYMILLDRHLPHVTEADVSGLTNAVSAMVAAAVAPSVDRLAEARPQIALRQLEMARRVVQANLQSPNFNIRTMCREVAMSRSALYRLLEPQGGRRAVHPAGEAGCRARYPSRSCRWCQDFIRRGGFLLLQRGGVFPGVSGRIRMQSPRRPRCRAGRFSRQAGSSCQQIGRHSGDRVDTRSAQRQNSRDDKHIVLASALLPNKW